MTMHDDVWPSGQLLFAADSGSGRWVGIVLDFAACSIDVYDATTLDRNSVHDHLFTMFTEKLLPALWATYASTRAAPEQGDNGGFGAMGLEAREEGAPRRKEKKKRHVDEGWETNLKGK